MKIRVGILKKEINSVDKKKWEEIKQNYNRQKNIIKAKIENNMYD